ncbi:DEKNAAC104527 [Brettanomyces naardenensis]|uniref:pyridoxal kinase n=1 Tax=Brettanomyces naardenensis TaxID=13370 RepID=A0A448YR83_BRENA|nr:DEKNAAC104527 [Brettanomyces naardenensis]
MRDKSQLLSQIHPARDILSISSHVVHGKVGNDAIQFPLNTRHWNVDCIHTTNLSNHPGYKQFKGSKSSPALIESLFEGVRDIKLQYDAAIVGYVASKDILETIYQKILLQLAEDTIVVVDPIMGDNGRLYVEEALVVLYKEIFSDERCENLIDLVTPNQFEMEMLTDIKISDLDTLKDAIRLFFKLYKVKHVVVTSVNFEDSDGMLCIGAKSDGEMYTVSVPKIDAVFSGSGDLFLGILTDRFVKSNGDLAGSLKHTVSVVHKVLEITYELGIDQPPKRYVDGKPYVPALRLVESRRFLQEDYIVKCGVTTDTTFL